MLLKYAAFAAILTLSVGICAADDTHIRIGAGGITYYSDAKDEQIELAEETVELKLSDLHYDVRVEFSFTNEGEERTYDIGFPVYASDLNHPENRWMQEDPVSSFQTQVNGQDVSFERRLDTEVPSVLAWYVKQVTFMAKSSTAISVSYTSKYGQEGGYGGIKIASYYYGSAKTWKGSIGKLVFRIINGSANIVYRARNESYAGRDIAIAPIDAFTTEVTYRNIIPSANAEFALDLISTFDFYWFTEGKLNKAIDTKAIQFFTSEQLSLYRNSIYAQNGYIFESAKLRSFFSRFDWYKPTSRKVDDLLSAAERQSVATIIAAEKARNAR